MIEPVTTFRDPKGAPLRRWAVKAGMLITDVTYDARSGCLDVVVEPADSHVTAEMVESVMNNLMTAQVSVIKTLRAETQEGYMQAMRNHVRIALERVFEGASPRRSARTAEPLPLTVVNTEGGRRSA